MRLSTQVKPIDYFEANAAQIVDELGNGGAPIIVTQNGEAKAVVMSIKDYEETKETLALLKLLSLAERNVDQGRTRPAREFLADLQGEIRTAPAA